MSRYAPHKCAYCRKAFAKPEDRDEHEDTCESKPVAGYFVGFGPFEPAVFVPDWRDRYDD